jgi:hypothetical protein
VFIERKWEKLLNPYPKINLDLLCEFYANALPDCEAKDMQVSFSYTTTVRPSDLTEKPLMNI